MNKSYQRTLVSNIGSLLASGSTENLAVSQIGIVDADSYAATVAPIYGKNKAIIIAQGVNAPIADALMSGLRGNRSEKTTAILGSNIIGWRAFRGSRGQQDVLAIGYDGSDTSKSITAKMNEVKYLYIKLTGQPITKLSSKNGLILRYSVHTGFDVCCGPDCQDCTDADPQEIVDYLVKTINADAGPSKHHGLIKARKNVTCSSPDSPTTQAYTIWSLTINDAADTGALGRVAAQYPGYEVTLYDRNEAQAQSTYRLTALTPTAAVLANAVLSSGAVASVAVTTGGSGYLSAPKVTITGNGTGATAHAVITNGVVTSIVIDAGGSGYSGTVTAAVADAGPVAFTTSTTTLIPDCPTCPTGYTQSTVTHLLKLSVPNGATVTSSQITGLIGKQLISDINGRDIYLITVNVSQSVASIVTQIEAVTAWDALYLKDSSFSCALNTATTVAWVSTSTGKKYQRNFKLTIQDSTCGTDRLSELVAAYASIGSVTLVGGAPTGACVHSYLIPIWSNFVEDECFIDSAVWTGPAAYQGEVWAEQVPASTATGCSYGIIIEANYTNRVPSKELFNFHSFETDGVHIQASNYDPDYNGPVGEDYWPVTYLQKFASVQNLGAQVRELEEYSKMYILRDYSFDAGVREAEGYELYSDANKIYDQYSLVYKVRYGVGGFAHTEEEKHTLNVFFPVGQGKAFESAINGFIASNPSLGLSPVSL